MKRKLLKFGLVLAAVTVITVPTVVVATTKSNKKNKNEVKVDFKNISTTFTYKNADQITFAQADVKNSDNFIYKNVEGYGFKFIKAEKTTSGITVTYKASKDGKLSEDKTSMISKSSFKAEPIDFSNVSTTYTYKNSSETIFETADLTNGENFVPAMKEGFTFSFIKAERDSNLITVTYKASKDGQLSEEKTATIEKSSFKQEVLNLNNVSTTWTYTEAATTTFNDVVLTDGTKFTATKVEGFDFTFVKAERANDVITVTYKASKDGKNSEEKTATIAKSSFKADKIDFTTVSTTWTYSEATTTTFENAVLTDGTKFTATKVEGFDFTFVKAERANDVITVTYKASKDGKNSEEKTATIAKSSFKADKIDFTTVSTTWTYSEATTTTFENAVLTDGTKFTATKVEGFDFTFVKAERANDVITVTYKVSKDGQESGEKTATIGKAGFKTPFNFGDTSTEWSYKDAALTTFEKVQESDLANKDNFIPAEKQGFVFNFISAEKSTDSIIVKYTITKENETSKEKQATISNNSFNKKPIAPEKETVIYQEIITNSTGVRFDQIFKEDLSFNVSDEQAKSLNISAGMYKLKFNDSDKKEIYYADESKPLNNDDGDVIKVVEATLTDVTDTEIPNVKYKLSIKFLRRTGAVWLSDGNNKSNFTIDAKLSSEDNPEDLDKLKTFTNNKTHTWTSKPNSNGENKNYITFKTVDGQPKLFRRFAFSFSKDLEHFNKIALPSEIYFEYSNDGVTFEKVPYQSRIKMKDFGHVHDGKVTINGKEWSFKHINDDELRIETTFNDVSAKYLKLSWIPQTITNSDNETKVVPFNIFGVDILYKNPGTTEFAPSETINSYKKDDLNEANSEKEKIQTLINSLGTKEKYSKLKTSLEEEIQKYDALNDYQKVRYINNLKTKLENSESEKEAIDNNVEKELEIYANNVKINVLDKTTINWYNDNTITKEKFKIADNDQYKSVVNSVHKNSNFTLTVNFTLTKDGKNKTSEKIIPLREFKNYSTNFEILNVTLNTIYGDRRYIDFNVKIINDQLNVNDVLGSKTNNGTGKYNYMKPDKEVKFAFINKDEENKKSEIPLKVLIVGHDNNNKILNLRIQYPVSYKEANNYYLTFYENNENDSSTFFGKKELRFNYDHYYNFNEGVATPKSNPIITTKQEDVRGFNSGYPITTKEQN
ncbi:hypothetical protein [Mycoplasma sp. OR1901]|uniref:hypothetical protein n=1 Tax=Mycoplasma sp. OR1901 TaxID=2742195 RepID=UPI001583B197|nr:hypothetical protein [Mycoplasma sp. OR1901]QKT05459.1 hypothetical protein HTZ87_01945 [Mycoplasma sp. OR1901]